MNRLLKFFEEKSNWKWISGSFLVLLSLKLLFDLQVVPTLEVLTGGIAAPDITFFYGVDYLSHFLYDSASEGLRYYLFPFTVIDIPFPLAFMLFKGLVIMAIMKRLVSAGSLWRYAVLIPAIGTLADYLENAGIVLGILLRTELSAAALHTIRVFSLVKVGSAMLSLVIVLIFGGLLLAKRAVGIVRKA